MTSASHVRPGVTSIATSLVLLCLCVSAHAQPAAAPTPHRLFTDAPNDTPLVVEPFTVLVTAARQRLPLGQCPAATTVMDARALQRMPRGIAVDEALFGVPGVRIDNQADGERVHVSIRGQGILSERGIRGIKVLLDGFTLNDPTGLAPDLYDVDWSTLDRVEVLRGPAAALYGGGGSGGVLNLTTRDGAAPATELGSVSVGSHGFWKALAEADGATEHVSYRMSLSRAAGDGYRDHARFWGNNLYGKTRWTPGDRVTVTHVMGWTDYFDENAEGLNLAQVAGNPRQANPDAAKFNEFYKTGRFNTGLSAQVALAPGQSLIASGTFRSTRYRMPVPSPVQRRTLITPGASLQYDGELAAGALRHHVSVGGDAQWQSIDEFRFANLGGAREGALLANQDLQQRGLGVFAIDRVEFGGAWALMLSARYDAMTNRLHDLIGDDPIDLSGDADFERATGRVGLAWTPVPRFSAYANWGQGFLPPQTEELANNPEHPGGFNTTLEPATSNGEELGARARLATGLSCELAAFQLRTQKDFDRFRTPSRPLETFYRNLGQSRRYGLEARVGWTPLRGLSVTEAWTWSDFRYTGPASIDRHGLPNSPAHQLDSGIEYEVMKGFTLGVTTQAQSRWWIDSANSAWTPGFTLWGAHASYRWHAGGMGGEATLAARNVLGMTYMAFTEPDPDGNSYQPGPKEEYFARLSLWH